MVEPNKGPWCSTGDPEMLNNVCATCLSSERRLYSLNLMMELADICNGIKLSQEDSICWECKAILCKFSMFRERVLCAKTTLGIWMQIPPPAQTSLNQSLSTLSFSGIILIPEETTRLIKEEVLSDGNGVQTVKKDFDSGIESVKLDGEQLIDVEIKEEQETNEDDLNSPEDFGDAHTDEQMTDEAFSVNVMSETEMLNYRAKERDGARFKNTLYKCEKCVVTFKNESSLKSHAALHSEKQGEYSCPVCARRFPCDKSASLHLKSHYRCFECHECGYRSVSQARMSGHCARHKPGMKKCTLCKDTFGSTQLLMTHLRTAHSDDVTCKQCNKTFRSKCMARRHARIHLEDVPLLECDVCQKQFRGDWRLRAHKRVHENMATENAYCAECDAQFKNVYLYRVHLKTAARHVAPQDRKFSCSDCGKRCTSKSLLKIHVELVHLRRRDHACELCGQTFKARIMLSRHKREKHSNRARKSILCDICGKAFTVRKCLIEHKNLHSGARPFECKICLATFSYSAALYNHNRLVHLKIGRNRKT